MDLLQELDRLVAALSRRGVDYAFCGGVALAIHGVPRATQDIDLLASPEDLSRVREIARELGFIFEAQPMTFSSSGISIVRFTKIIDKQPLMLDVLLAQGPLENIWNDRLSVPYRDGEVRVVSRAGLISLKLAAARPQDLVDVQRLEEASRG
jgi:hypothetical protein